MLLLKCSKMASTLVNMSMIQKIAKKEEPLEVKNREILSQQDRVLAIANWATICF